MAETPEPGRQRRRHIDWKQAARLMAAGQSPAATAAATGISENQLWRHFETSRHFRSLILQAGESRRSLALTLQKAGAGGDQPGEAPMGRDTLR